MSINIKQESQGIVITTFTLLAHYRTKRSHVLLESRLLGNMECESELPLSTVHKDVYFASARDQRGFEPAVTSTSSRGGKP